VTKRYHPPATPYQRLLASGAVPQEIKAKLRGMFTVLHPLRLLGEIRAAQELAAVGRKRGGEAQDCRRAGAHGARWLLGGPCGLRPVQNPS
jgi:hypothetical protein